MATLELTTYEAKPNRIGGGFAIALGIGSPDPYPTRKVEVVRLADVQAAFESYKTDVAAAELAKPVAVSARIVGRSPPGFKDWWKVQGRNYAVPVNF